MMNSAIYSSDWPGKIRHLCNSGVNIKGVANHSLLVFSPTTHDTTSTQHYCWVRTCDETTYRPLGKIY